MLGAKLKAQAIEKEVISKCLGTIFDAHINWKANIDLKKKLK